MVRFFAGALCALTLLALPATAPAQAPDEAAEAAATAPAAPAEAETRCAPKRKKRGGLGGLLGAARSSGLLGAVAGRAGAGGHLIGSAANTAIAVGSADAARQAGTSSC